MKLKNDMNYEEFLCFKNMNAGKYKDFSETNLYSYFHKKGMFHVSAEVKGGHIGNDIHRCHLVEDFLKHLHLPEAWKVHVGASSGVRVSLGLLMDYFKDKIWNIPFDVYPFYIQVSSNKKINVVTYGVTESIQWTNGVVLSVYPQKPYGYQYTKQNVNAMKSWLSQDVNNILIIDAVYSHVIDDVLKELYATNQVIILTSLSKQFLLPNHFGIALCMQNDIGNDIRQIFKALPRDELKMRISFNALKYCSHYPSELRSVYHTLREKTCDELKLIKPILSPDSYFIYHDVPWLEYLDRGILTIPPSVFGSTKNGSVISILH